jgi:hypothetical protein
MIRRSSARELGAFLQILAKRGDAERYLSGFNIGATVDSFDFSMISRS